MKTIRAGFVVAGLALACASQAEAQGAAAATVERRVFLDLNAAVGSEPDALETSSTFPLFGETGAVATRQQPAASLLADARIGVRVAPRFAVAFGFAGGRSETTGKAVASIPSPIRFASPTLVALDAPDLKHRESAYHFQAVWLQPLSSSITLALSGGPSVIRVQQGVPVVSVATGGGATSIDVANEKGTALGGHVAVDLSYGFTDLIGVGAFGRYVAANLDLPSATDVKAGGLQFGGGIRLRF